MTRQPFAVVLTALLLPSFAAAQTTPKAAADQYRAAHEQQILKEFTSLLATPNVASDKANIQRNAETLVQALEKRHVAAKLLQADGANPVVYGEIKTAGAKHTIVFYAHYDGQPVTPDDWDGKAPFTPVTRMVNGEPRIYARSASRRQGRHPRAAYGARRLAGGEHPSQGEPALYLGGRRGSRLDEPRRGSRQI